MLTITYSYDGLAARSISLDPETSAMAQTAAIQSALDAVAGHAGAHVVLSAGTFTVAGTGIASDGALRVGSETTLEGAGMGATVIKLADGSTTTTGIIRTDSGGTSADGSVRTTSNVLIADLTIDGNKAHTTGDVDGFYCGPQPNSAAADSSITLDHVEVMNVSRYGFDPHEQTVGLTISNCSSHGNGADGYTIDFATHVSLVNDVAYDNGRHGFNIVTSSSDVAVTHVEAYGNGGSGIAIQTGNNEVRSFVDGVRVSGSSVHDNGRFGIEVKQAGDIDIDHVVVSGNDMGGVALLGVTHATLTGNSIAGNGGVAVKIDGYLQTFGDTDALNDRYIATHDVSIDGVLQPDPAVPPGVTPWSWWVTSGADLLQGSAGADHIAAGAGNDTVYGNAGADVLYAGDGNDRIDGGVGDDTAYGGAGADLIALSAGHDWVDGGSGADTLDGSGYGSALAINLAASGTEVMTTGTATALTGPATIAVADLSGIEAIWGTAYDDMMIGNGSANSFAGGAGNDALAGAGGNDTLAGGSGNDTLSGGSGKDVFVLAAGSGSDTIQDFQRGSDKIDLSAGAGLTSFSQLAIVDVAGMALVTFGSDHILLEGVTAAQLKASDFILH